MTDLQWMAYIDSLLERLWQTHAQFERLFDAQIDAYNALLDAVEKNDQRRLPALRRDHDSRYQASASVFRTHSKHLESLQKALREWKSPGREFVRFRDQAARLLESYIQASNDAWYANDAMRNSLKEIK